MIKNLSHTERGGVRAFEGIRYARAERFSESVLLDSVEQWDRSAGEIPTAPQLPGTIEQLLGTQQQPMSEDCLFLNVFTPASANSNSSLPVLVWVHGGAYLNGSGTTPWYDGENLAANGCVVVTINYRLGLFGFLHTNNWGIGDQMNALRWVNKHIASFGGSPENVTIFGESAGGSSVIALMSVPGIEDLVHRVAAFSPSLGQYRFENLATERHSEFLKALSELGDHDPASCPVEILLQAQAAVLAQPDRSVTSFSPTHGGTHVSENIITSATNSPLPLIIGTTKDENLLFTAFDPEVQKMNRDDVIKRISWRFRERSPQIYDAYAENFPQFSPPRILAAIETDGTFRVPALSLADSRDSLGNSSYVYWFTVETQAFDGALGSCHAADIPFVFDNLHKPGVKFFLGEVEGAPEIAKRFSGLILDFASGREPWPIYSRDSKPVLRIDREHELVHSPDSDLLALWH